MLNRLAGLIALTSAVVACSSAPPPSTPGPDAEPSIAARWVADDGSVVALNVVLGRGMDPRHIPELARRYRGEHQAARVIVTFFAASAGQERFVIGYVPTDGGRRPADPQPSTVLAAFDFPATTQRTPTTTAGAP